MEYAILATEGVEDQAILCSVLRCMGFRSVNVSLQDLDPFWLDLVPRFPKTMIYHGLKNLPYPYIFILNDISVAIYQGQGSKLAQNLLDIMLNAPRYKRDVFAFGIVVDADTKQPSEVVGSYANNLKSVFPSFPVVPGVISSHSPRMGVYVWPDNQHTGTLETLLLDCAGLVYADHKSGGARFIDGLSAEYKWRWKGADAEKALVASIVSILQPGQANYVSFARSDDEWISAETLAHVSGVKKFWIFIHELLGLPL